ncbi:phospholipase D-like domain-containing protein [Aestuariibaculum suncheonense]|uniref:Phospholipase D-like domain-containing protein n=1 Tax=Aestuariibaculum suncheonense TaxID=1028745 RepID=A0A8J6Q4X3_9FLAO|nr:hypothetical protein [Aestuariibaculum suncheonense]MBD0834472.1 hypothetical protein [Aestuariibaculum suncheonense]
MKFIAPLEISSKIMTLIEEATKELVLVSPYVEISNWDKMKKCLQRAIDRGVNITFIARKNATQDLSFLKRNEIKLVLVNDLHAKLYLNENYGIVTSQNIVYYSDINSIDIAYRTTENEEREELIEFIKKYISDLSPKVDTTIEKIESTQIKIPELGTSQFKNLCHKFINTYKSAKFTPTSTYIFSGNLLHFADVMISAKYTIKISKEQPMWDKLIDAISNTHFKFKHKFELDLERGNNKYAYISFIPIKVLHSSILTEDFFHLTNEIIRSRTINELAPVILKYPSEWQ